MNSFVYRNIGIVTDMTEFDKFGRRRKFQRELYTPGSGPLRKSGKEDTPPRDVVYRNIADYKTSGPSTDRAAELSKITEKLKEISLTNSNGVNEPRNNDTTRRNRKPDCELYVPKPVAEAYANRQRERDTKSQEKVETRHESEFNKDFDSVHTNSKSDRRSQDRSVKRKDRRKKTRSCIIEDNNASSEEKSSSLQKYKSRESVYNEDRDFSRNRLLRQGSEPVPVTFAQDRLKDLRSIDTSMYVPEKNNSKPPLGRRGSLSKSGMKLPATFDCLPPRLQRKYIAENAIHDLNKTPSVGSNVENSRWDGHSVTFQGKPGTHSDQQKNMKNPPAEKITRGFAEWSKTLPTPVRSKGRGRLNRENHADLYEPLRYSRSLTPEKLNDSRFENAPHELEISPNQGKMKSFEKENRVFRELSDSAQITSENKKDKLGSRSSLIDNCEETRKPIECSDTENVIVSMFTFC